MKYLLTYFLLLMLVASASADPGKTQIGKFSESGLDGWSEKSFKGHTEYRIVEESGQTGDLEQTGASGQRVLQAKSSGTASGLIFETEYDPNEYPILSWRWKVANTIVKGDSRTKQGDDYAARIYVVFPHWLFLKTKTLNYIWANQLPKDSSQISPYASNDMMIAVESGPGKVGQWLAVRRNLVEDYRLAFGEEPPAVGAIAIMTDTDDTGESAVAWYSDITASQR